MEKMMTAKKTAGRKTAGAKPTKAKTSARKAVKSVPAKTALKKAAPAARAPAKTSKPTAAVASNSKKQPAAKIPAAAARSHKTPSASFDPDRRRELIAAAAARQRKSATAKPAPAPIVITPQREPSPVERHRFSVGDSVRVVSTSGMWFKHGIDYRVTAALPPQAGKLQYRIKNEQEPFERVVSESQLAFAQAAAAHARF